MKICRFLPLCGVAVLMTACTQEADIISAGESKVVFNTVIPAELASRSFGEGSAVSVLTYAVYEKGTDSERLVICNENVQMQGGTATFSLNLTRGKTYEVIFWADCRSKNKYEFNSEKKTISIDYDAAEANDDAWDAFYASTTLTVQGASSETVALHRPFAQINIGTSDIETSKVDPENLTSSMSVSTYSTLNLSTGEVSDPVTAVFTATPTPGMTETYPGGSDYYYLAMNYVLTGKEKSLESLTFSVSEGTTKLIDERTLENIPMQRNYRTNISGSLLTDATTFTVTVAPTFDGTNGESPENPNHEAPARKPQTITENGKEIFLIADKEELNWIAQNSTTVDWQNSEMRFTNDIDMNGEAWTPITIDIPTTDPIVIDGGGHKITNYTFDNSVGDKGLFGTLTNAEIKNLSVADVRYSTTEATENMGAIVGSINGKLDNVSATGIDLNGAQNVGAIAGRVSGGTADYTKSTISYVEVKDSKISASEAAGGIAGVFESASVARNAGSVFVVNEAVVFPTSLAAGNSNMTGVLAGRAVSMTEKVGAAGIYCEESARYIGGGADVDILTMDEYRQEGQTIYVDNIDQLRKAFKEADDGTTICLTRNLNFYNKIIEPVVIGSKSNLIFDGGCHTISNFRLSEIAESSVKGSALFVDLNGYTLETYHSDLIIRNINFDNVKLSGKVQAVVINRLNGNLSNINISNCEIDASDVIKVGLACGTHLKGTISNIVISDSSVAGNEEVGGLVGCTGSNNGSLIFNYDDINISNTTVSSVYAPCGAVVGRKYNASVTINLTNVTLTDVAPENQIGKNN